MTVVAFDSLGTLFALGDLRARMARPLQHAAALTLAGMWAPFDEIVQSVDRELAERLTELEPYEDARRAVERVRTNDAEPWVLTNGGRELTQALLDRGGLLDFVSEVRTTEEVRKYKPHPDVYGLLPGDATLVAAHAWDVVGATRAGVRGVWVDRVEQQWPLPLPEAELRASDLVSAAGLAIGPR